MPHYIPFVILLFVVSLISGIIVDYFAQKSPLPNLGPIVSISIVGAAILWFLMLPNA